jgi:stearoyl-CoA desaturase (delta-9 desaturase)
VKELSSVKQKFEQLEFEVMAPKSAVESHESDSAIAGSKSATASPAHDAVSPAYRVQIVWRNVALMSALHLSAVYGLWLLLTEAAWSTWIWVWLLNVAGGLGITAGAHRLWSHRSFKAKTPLRVILMIFNCIALQNDVIEWARDHRVHHKHSETDADPHNAKRGLFFSHIGWLLCRKHPEVIRRGKQLPLDDLHNDPVLQFQRRYYRPLVLLFCFGLPTIVPYLAWGETLRVAYFTSAMLRYAWLLNVTWTVNSLAHRFGSRPFDKHISPAQNFTTILLAHGEGWHNYHHSFPFDYRTSEYPWRFNITTIFIDFFGAIGWAYDFRQASPTMIEQKRQRSGDVIKSGFGYVYG